MMNRSMTAAASLAILGGTAQAQLFDSFSTGKDRIYTQTSIAQPSIADFYGYRLALFDAEGSVTAHNIGTVTVTFPDGVQQASFTGDQFGVFATYFSPTTYSTEAALDAALPAGDYAFDLSGGLFGDIGGSLQQPAFNPWNEVPYVTNFNDIQNAAAGVDLLVDYNDWTPNSATTPLNNFVFYSVQNLTTGTTVFGTPFGLHPGEQPTEFTIPGGLLTPGDYQINILYSARIALLTPDFEGAVAINSFDTYTNVPFTVVPAPSSAGMLALAGLAAARRRR